MSNINKIVQVDKPVTVEEAALKYSEGSHLEYAYIQEIPAFIAGAEWQKEQLAIDAIEFMQFRDDHCTKMGERWMTLFAGDGGKLYTIKELYELWKQIN